MRVTFYDTRIDESMKPILIKKKTVLCAVPSCNDPSYVAESLNQTCSLNTLSEESCYLLALNSKCKVLGVFHLSKGTVCQAPIGVREIFMKALLVGAVQIIICHNHPSGDCTPSAEDVAATKRVKEAGGILGIPLADSIVVGIDDCYYSFHEQGML